MPKNVSEIDKNWLNSTFNEDGNLDFVLTYYYNENSHLFLGDGNFGFGEPILLQGCTSSDSIAADAADFDNDGHADFVSAPSDYSLQLYVNFGDGSGNFETRKIDTYEWS